MFTDVTSLSSIVVTILVILIVILLIVRLLFNKFGIGTPAVITKLSDLLQSNIIDLLKLNLELKTLEETQGRQAVLIEIETRLKLFIKETTLLNYFEKLILQNINLTVVINIIIKELEELGLLNDSTADKKADKIVESVSDMVTGLASGGEQAEAVIEETVKKVAKSAGVSAEVVDGIVAPVVEQLVTDQTVKPISSIKVKDSVEIVDKSSPS